MLSFLVVLVIHAIHESLHGHDDDDDNDDNHDNHAGTDEEREDMDAMMNVTIMLYTMKIIKPMETTRIHVMNIFLAECQDQRR